jgi:electron transport complex protein RnfC
VAGVVEDVTEMANFTGQKVTCVVIKPDAEQPAFAGTSRDPQALSAAEIREVAKEAGLVGMGGAAFPTHVKLAPPADKPIDVVLINGCECEPFLTCDHRLMLERPADMISGLRLLMKAVGASRGIVGIEANKPDAVEAVRAAAGSDIEVAVLPVKYPEGAEKMLISVITGRKVPPGKLPSEVGALVQNPGTAVALAEAASTGKPLYERVLTVTGTGVSNPKNLLVAIGTPIGTLIKAAGGLKGDVERLIMGGPMTGWAQNDQAAPIQKGTSGIVALTPDMASWLDEEECVRCGKCLDACPMNLMPSFIAQTAKRGQWDQAEMWGALDCF